MLIPDFDYELSLLPPGTRYLLGIDEVGRGPWAGPVTLGAFLLDLKSFDLDLFQKLKVRDSKKLSQSQRETIVKEFRKLSFPFKTFSASSQKIDQQGIAFCLDSLLNSALSHFSGSFDFVLVDGNQNFSQEYIRAVISADAKTFSVASASIVAKVVRDLKMEAYHKEYPDYSFKDHKGYGTKKHLEALKKHGPCPIHRKSYKPIKKLIDTKH